MATRLEINDSRFTGRKPTVLKSNDRELKAWFSFVLGDFTVSQPSQSLRSNVEGDGNENGQKAIGLGWQNNNFARESRFFVHFFAVTARLRRGNV